MAQDTKVVLTRADRKERLGHGGLREIARLAGVTDSFVSHVVAGRKRHQRIEDLITGRIGRPGEEVFPPRIAPQQEKEQVAA